MQPSKDIDKNEVSMTYWLSEWFEDTWDVLDFSRSTHQLPREMPAAGIPGFTQADAAGQQEQNTPEKDIEKMRSLLVDLPGKSWTDENLNFFIKLSADHFVKALKSEAYVEAGITPEILVDVIKYVISSDTYWFQYKSSCAVQRGLWSSMRDSVKDKKFTMYVACIAAKLLRILGVGNLVRSRGWQP